PEGVISLRALKGPKKVVESNPSASLIDLGDGVVCLEFHSKLNTIDADTVEMIHAAVDRVAREFVGLVVANEGENFSVARTSSRSSKLPGPGAGTRSRLRSAGSRT